MRSKLLLRSGNLSRLTLWWMTADRLLIATSTPSSKSLMYKTEKKTSSSPIMWHRYAKRTTGWLCPSSSRCKEARGQPQRDRRRTSGTMCTCDSEEIERGTHESKEHDLSTELPAKLLENFLRSSTSSIVWWVCKVQLLPSSAVISEANNFSESLAPNF